MLRPILLVLMICTPIMGNELDLLQPKYGYNNARILAAKRDVPLVVVVGATWCAPCAQYKIDTVKKLASNNGEYVLSYVDFDRDSELLSTVFGDKEQKIPFTVIKRDKEQAKMFYGPKPIKDVLEVIKSLRAPDRYKNL